MTIKIRAYKIEDINDLYDAVIESKEHLSKWMPWCHEQYNKNDTEQWVTSSIEAWDNQSEYRFLIENLVTGKILGAIGISRIIKCHKVAEIGYWVRQSEVNKGVCKEAAHQANQA